MYIFQFLFLSLIGLQVILLAISSSTQGKKFHFWMKKKYEYSTPPRGGRETRPWLQAEDKMLRKEMEELTPCTFLCGFALQCCSMLMFGSVLVTEASHRQKATGEWNSGKHGCNSKATLLMGQRRKLEKKDLNIEDGSP